MNRRIRNIAAITLLLFSTASFGAGAVSTRSLLLGRNPADQTRIVSMQATVRGLPIVAEIRYMALGSRYFPTLLRINGQPWVTIPGMANQDVIGTLREQIATIAPVPQPKCPDSPPPVTLGPQPQPSQLCDNGIDDAMFYAAVVTAIGDEFAAASVDYAISTETCQSRCDQVADWATAACFVVGAVSGEMFGFMCIASATAWKYQCRASC